MESETVKHFPMDGVTLHMSIGQPHDYDGYAVRCVRDRGIVVTGAIPVRELVAIAQGWKRDGWDLVDALIAQHLGACMVVTNRNQSALWRAELGIAETEDESDGK